MARFAICRKCCREFLVVPKPGRPVAYCSNKCRDGANVTYKPKRPVEEFIEDWQPYRNCANVPTVWFFPDGEERVGKNIFYPFIDRVRAICGKCPVRRECLKHAIDHNEFGIWGGLTRDERDKGRLSMRNKELADTAGDQVEGVRKHDKQCPECLSWFSTQHKLKMFCSSRCANRAGSRDRRERAKA